MKVSVIVPTYNRPKAFELCLLSLTRQSRLPDEVLIAETGLTPVVAYNSGGLVEILHKGWGHLVNGETADFAQAMPDLLHDDTQREQLGREGRPVVEEHFPIAAMGDAHRIITVNFYVNSY